MIKNIRMCSDVERNVLGGERNVLGGKENVLGGKYNSQLDTVLSTPLNPKQQQLYSEILSMLHEEDDDDIKTKYIPFLLGNLPSSTIATIFKTEEAKSLFLSIIRYQYYCTSGNTNDLKNENGQISQEQYLLDFKLMYNICREKKNEILKNSLSLEEVIEMLANLILVYDISHQNPNDMRAACNYAMHLVGCHIQPENSEKIRSYILSL